MLTIHNQTQLISLSDSVTERRKGWPLWEWTTTTKNAGNLCYGSRRIPVGFGKEAPYRDAYPLIHLGKCIDHDWPTNKQPWTQQCLNERHREETRNSAFGTAEGLAMRIMAAREATSITADPNYLIYQADRVYPARRQFQKDRSRTVKF